MATLDKIKICGIRSFGCEEEDVQTVYFKKPLTLILGENGCGKSTIIECLRYLTAQREPAGKGTFVHDPSLTNRATVKGFVKLRMWDVKGTVVDLCRQVQATRTKNSIMTKSLDNVITKTNKETKEKVSISNRCADFSVEISRLFGVSKSILENVMFCTQEDSNWPLETDQKLKEKFDQIFDSDKYNKCVNKVREKKKKIKEILLTSQVELKYLKENKHMAVEKRRKLRNTRVQVKSCKQEIEQLNSSLERVNIQLKEVNEKEMKMNKNNTLKEMKKTELNGVEKVIAELKSRIKSPYVGTNDELKEEINKFKRELSLRQKEIEVEEYNVRQCCARESTLSSNLMVKQGMLGQLLKEEELNQERMNQRNEDLMKLASKLKLEVLMENTENFIRKLMSDVKAMVTVEEENLTKTKRIVEVEEQNIQAEINKLREEFVTIQNEVTNKEKNLKATRCQREKTQKELNEVNMSASKLNDLEMKLDEVNSDLKNLEESIDLVELKENVKKFSKERNELEERLSKMEEETKRLQHLLSLSTELDFQTEMKSAKDVQFRRLISKHEDNLKLLLGELPEGKFKSAVQNRFSEARQKVKEFVHVRSKKEKELTELEMRRKHLNEKLESSKNLLRRNEEEIYEICGSEDFDETVTAVRKELEELQDLKGTLTSSEFMYQRYILALQKSHPCCPLCHRDFERTTEAESLAEDLTIKIKEVPNRLRENKILLNEKQAKYNELLAAKSKHDKIWNLKNKEIPELRSDLEKTESSLKEIKKELSDLIKELNSPQSDEALCLSIQDDMVLLDEIQAERIELEKQMEKLRDRLESGGCGKEALENLLREQEETRGSLKVARQNADESQGKLNSHNETLQGKQCLRSSLIEEINKIQGGTGKRNNLMERLEEIGHEEAVLMAESSELQRNWKSLKNKLDDSILRGKSEIVKNSKMIEKMSEFVNELLKDLHDVESHQKSIENHVTKGIAEKIESIRAEMKKTEEEIGLEKRKIEEWTNKINQIKKGLSNRELVERELEDNIRLREKTIESENLRKEVESLEKNFGHLNFDTILRNKGNLKRKEEEFVKNKAQIEGRLMEMEDLVKMLEKELKGNVFKNVDEKYNAEYLKYETWNAIANDLERYATTMEYAMMKYHKKQMTRVNAFIREYWRNIYQGNDIDYIEILTDNIDTGEKRRNYSYKVVQVKSDVYLDMRNKCSAGQKMLASLIIRLALAETFSSNCGILTLDEPTTNLDRRNIKNLARTLKEVLLTKQNASKSNFQLIIITHDEEFLKELLELDVANEYVKVDRSTRGKTMISNQALSEEPSLQRVNGNPERPQYDYD